MKPSHYVVKNCIYYVYNSYLINVAIQISIDTIESYSSGVTDKIYSRKFDRSYAMRVMLCFRYR